MKLWTLFATLLINLTLFFTACSSDDKNAGGTSEAENSIAITDKTVAGVSQKGPFTNGSVVTLYELNFRTRAQTGKSFFGKISDDKGSFSINNIELASQYALLRADGFYRNEITGKVSTSQITLNAISDLSERDNVNINLLTHLEYERAIWLAQENEISISEAKVEADKEIFAAFGAEYDGNHFEDLNIFGSGDADAALLAISVIMHAGRSEGEFSLALANLAMDLQKDGQWNDSTAITDAADNSFDADTVQIRRNMEEWNIANLIPDFAPVVEYFWNDAFGLGRCTANREGEIRANSNSRSRYLDHDFVCENGHWHLLAETATSSSSEHESSSSSIKRSSSSRQSTATVDPHYYEESSVIDPDVLAILGTCSDDNESTVKKSFNISFVCKSGLWYSLLLADMEQDSWFNPDITYGTLTDQRDGQTYRTVVIGTQNWMAENLHYAGENASEELATNMADEDLCPSGDEDYCEKAGYVYSWTAAMNISRIYQTRIVATLPINEVHQGICPDGWHIPTLDEWDTLFDYVISTYGEDEQITALKAVDSWVWYGKEHIPSNKTGFSAVANGESSAWIGLNTNFFSATYNQGQTECHAEEDFKHNEFEKANPYQPHDHKAYVRCVENAQ